ncbi:MAG: septal ring lytic transglycosylase RlpA family protein [Gammaproteobacteria bacterium]|nr:septal ring lytic transglycosylase RlpA family protein [Gammaproteobacteria bacterium]
MSEPLNLRFWLVSILSLFLLIGCGGKKSKDRGYYGGDSAPAGKHRDFSKIPDAVPKAELPSRTGNKPYVVFGKKYIPLKSSAGFTQTGMASWYGTKFHGRRTSSGEPYDMWTMTAAHPVLPLPTYVEVTSLETGKRIVVKVNDRGPFLHNRIIDLSYAAAHKIGIADKGVGRVTIRALDASGHASGPVPASSAKTHSSGQRPLYYVQTGSFVNSENSLEMRDWIRNQGYRLFPESNRQHLGGGIPYRVRVGPFQSLDRALQSQRKLENLLGEVLLLVTEK